VNYQEFIAKKRIEDVPTGFGADGISDQLFDFQRDIVRWACRRGRAALFENCGLGKTPQQLVWANQVLEKTGRNQIIFAPLGVSHQTVREGVKFGIDVHLAASQDDVRPGITVTNYEKMHKFDLSQFGGVVLDESSILKSYDGATRNLIITTAARVPFKLACTATPAPNDYMELGNHAEFLGVMSRPEMLATFFVHDGGDTAKWRLKGHAETEFWKWLCSWAVNIRAPIDLGYENGNFNLPALNMQQHIVRSNQQLDGYLFALPASSLQERRDARRGSLSERVEKACELADDNQWVFWCNLNAERCVDKGSGREGNPRGHIRGRTRADHSWIPGWVCEAGSDQGCDLGFRNESSMLLQYRVSRNIGQLRNVLPDHPPVLEVRSDQARQRARYYQRS
jgi:hypothetical protein